MQTWTIDAARNQYAIAHWGEDYFDVGDDGGLIVRPRGADGPALSLPQIVEAATAQGSRLPMLVRFGDILRDRLGRLQGAFARAMADWDYAGGYTAVVSGEGESAARRGRANSRRRGCRRLRSRSRIETGIDGGARAGEARQHRHLQRLQGSRISAARAGRPQARAARVHRHREAIGTETRARGSARARMSSRCSACACV